MIKKIVVLMVIHALFAASVFCLEKKPAEKDVAVPTDAYMHYLNAVLFEKDNKLEEAAREYEKTLQIDPKAAYVYKNLAGLYIKMGRIDEAKNLAEKVVELDKTDPDVYSFLGTIYYLKGDLEKANDMFERMYELDKTRKESLIYIANINFKTNPRKSLEFLLKYIEEDSQAAEVHYQIALIYSELGEQPNAIEYFKKAIELEPEHFQAHLAIAREYEKQNKVEKAIGHYQKCLEIDPENRILAEYLGTLYLEKSDYKEAEKIFKKIKESSKSDILSNFWLGILAEEKSDFEKAIQYIKSMSGYEKDVSLLLRLSYYYARVKNTKKSIETLRKAYEIDPSNPEVCFFLGLAYETDGKMDLALEYFNKAVAIKDDFPEAHFQRAVVLDKQKKFRQSVQALLKVISLNPGHAAAYNYLGYSFADRNMRLEYAETLVNAALKIDPENGAYIDSLGWVYYRNGEYEKAIEQLETAKEKLKDPVIVDHLGDALWMKHRFAKTGDHIEDVTGVWEESLRLDPGNKVIQRKIERTKKYGFEFPEEFRELNKTTLQYKDLLESLSCMMSVSSNQPRARFSVRGLFYYKKGTGLRMDIMGPFMVPAGSIFYTDRIRILPEEFNSEMRGLFGDNGEAIEGIAELVGRFFDGRFVKEFFDPSVMEKKRGRWITFENQFASVRIDYRRRRVVRYKYFSNSGFEVLAEMKDFTALDGINIPKRIDVRIPELRQRFTLKLNNISINQEAGKELFKPAEPAPAPEAE